GSWDKTAKLWNARTGKEIRTFQGHTDMVQSVAFSKDGKLLVTGSHDKTVRVWDVDTGKEVSSLRYRGVVWSVSFSSDGKRIATGCWSKTGWVKIWSAD